MRKKTTEEAFNFIGEWVAEETTKRRYDNEQVKELSFCLKKVRDFIRREEVLNSKGGVSCDG